MTTHMVIFLLEYCCYDRGPYNIKCLTGWWIEAGCSSEGSSSPQKNPHQVNWWNGHSSSAVKQDMRAHARNAMTRTDYYNKCYGVQANQGASK